MMLEAARFDVHDALAPVRRALGLARIRHWMLRGAGAGMLVAACAVLLSHVLSRDATTPLLSAAFFVLCGVAAGAVIGLRAWPGHLEAARTADRYFSLQDRLTTALELHAGTHPLAGAQRDDASRHIVGLALGQSGRGGVRRWEVAASAGAALLLVLSLLWGGDNRATGRSASSGDAASAHRVARTVLPSLQRSLTAPLPPGVPRDPALRKLDAAMAQLRRQLLHISTRAGALRAIAATQAKLQRIAASLHPVSPHSASALAPHLASAMTPKERTAAAAGGKRALAAMASALHRMAQNLKNLSPAQRAALARSLAQAANTSTDSQVATQLHQAASSLGYNDPQTAAQALQSAASAFQKGAGQSEAQHRASSASKSLDALRNQVAGLNSQPSSSSSDTGSQSNGSGTGSQGGSSGSNTPSNGGVGQGFGKGSSQGQGSGKGQGSGGGKGTGSGSGKGGGSGKGSGAGQGQGSGQGQGQGQGNGHGSGSGSGGTGGTGGHGRGGGRGGVGPQGQGRFATVYIPTHAGKGVSTTQTGPSGTPSVGPIVPYRQVIARYEADAHSALDGSPLPPSLRTYVRTYFSAISH